MKILIADDDATVRRYVSRALKDDAEVMEASNEREAFRLFEENKFDAALVDVNLGADDGIELAAALRDLDPLLKVIVISGDVTNEIKVRQKGLGKMLSKPFTSEELKLALFSRNP